MFWTVDLLETPDSQYLKADSGFGVDVFDSWPTNVFIIETTPDHPEDRSQSVFGWCLNGISDPAPSGLSSTVECRSGGLVDCDRRQSLRWQAVDRRQEAAELSWQAADVR